MAPTLTASLALVTSLLLLMTSGRVRGHGRLVEPPSRSSMWRYGFSTPRNYNDNGLNCGGMSTQWHVNGGRCGVCGDPWNKPTPRDNEAGGRFGKGVITRTYTPGQVMEVNLQITANHQGWFEFRLCEHNSPTTVITQQCLDQHLLQLADGSGTRYSLAPHLNFVKVSLQLPQGVTCSQCVLQWKWHAANNFGTDSTGRSCVGCGEEQEEFYACSDIAIGGSPNTNTPPLTRPHNLIQSSSSSSTSSRLTFPSFKPIIQSTAAPVKTYSPFQPITQKPNVVTVKTYPPFRPVTVKSTAAPVKTYPPFQPITAKPTVATVKTYPPFRPVTVKSTAAPIRTYPPFQPITMKPSIATLKTNPPFKPFTGQPSRPVVTHQPTTHPSTPTPGSSSPPPGSVMVCVAINDWQGVPNLDLYCKEQCPQGNCPTAYCSCSYVTTRAMPTAPAQPITSTVVISPTTPPTPRLIPQSTTTPRTPKTVGTPTTARYTQACRAINSWKGRPDLDEWCNRNCPIGVCPSQNCQCGLSVGAQTTPTPTTTTPTTTTTTPITTTTPTTTPTPSTSTTTTPFMPPLLTASSQEECFAIGPWAGQPQLDQWCSQTCVQYGCDRNYCDCRPLTTSPAPSQLSGSGYKCHAINGWAGQAQLDQWCDQKCAMGLCPPQYCGCNPNVVP